MHNLQDVWSGCVVSVNMKEANNQKFETILAKDNFINFSKHIPKLIYLVLFKVRSLKNVVTVSQ